LPKQIGHVNVLRAALLAILRLHATITNIKVCAAATTDRRLVFNLQVAVLSVVIEERRVDEGFRSFPLHMAVLGANVISGELM